MKPTTRKEMYLDAITKGIPCSLDPVDRTELALENLAANCGGSGGASSWNDLADKPFGEYMSNGDVIGWNPYDYGDLPEVWVSDTTKFVKVTDVVPTMEELDNGCSVREIQRGDNYRHYDGLLFTSEDNIELNYDGTMVTIPTSGTYFLVGEEPGLALKQVSVAGFTGYPPIPVAKRLDEKYMPLLTDPYGGVWKLCVDDGGYVFAEPV